MEGRICAPWLALLISGFVFAGNASGQERRHEVNATYLGINRVQEDPAVQHTFRYQYADRAKWLNRVPGAAAGDAKNNPPIGVLNWEVPRELFGTAGMDRQFRTYCAEAPVGVAVANTYRFEIQSPAVPETYGLPVTDAGKIEGIRRSLYLRELYGRYYILTLTDAKAASAFQIAVWEIIHEASWPEDKPAPLDLSAGTFQAAAEQDDPDTVALARDYLKSLTGDDNVFYENPDLAGRELVRMKGLASAIADDKTVVPQSQLALQFVRGGVNAPGGAAFDPAGNAIPVGGLFGGGPLAGAGGAAGGFAAGMSGGGSGGSSPAGSNTTTPPIGTNGVETPSSRPPVASPPDDTTTPPNNPPDTPSNPVPAPAAVVLGIIGVGALLGRRAFARKAAMR